MNLNFDLSHLGDSNPGPADYESTTLSQLS